MSVFQGSIPTWIYCDGDNGDYYYGVVVVVVVVVVDDGDASFLRPVSEQRCYSDRCVFVDADADDSVVGTRSSWSCPSQRSRCHHSSCPCALPGVSWFGTARLIEYQR